MMKQFYCGDCGVEPFKNFLSCNHLACEKECFGRFSELQNFNFRKNCVASIKDAKIKMPRLAVDLSKVVFLVPTELVEKSTFRRLWTSELEFENRL